MIALDRVNNPQNLGMIIRSCCAAGIDGLIISSEAGNTRLSPLVVKASAGTIFRTPIYRTGNLLQTLRVLAENGYQSFAMAAGKGDNALLWQGRQPTVFVLGNETEGVRPDILAATTGQLHIPMANGVESLNLAVTASLLAFRPK
jgi:23S rRNA (guanosine2251-2'-O)-methyltransferase